MSDSLKSFAKATIEKLHFVLGLISGLGVIAEAFRAASNWHGWGSLLQFAVDLDWFLGVSIVYAFIFLIVGSFFTFVIVDLVALRRPDKPRKDKMMSQMTTPVMIVAGVAGILTGFFGRHETIHGFSDLPGAILFRVIGFLAICWLVVAVGTLILRIPTHRTSQSPAQGSFSKKR
jgi:hypothetical protein